MEHTIRFPLPFSFHVVYVIVSVIMLILCYRHRKYTYELYMLIGVASTMLVYIAEPKPIFYILALEEMILFILIIVDMVKVSRRLAAEEKAAAEKAAELAAQRDAAMNAQMSAIYPVDADDLPDNPLAYLNPENSRDGGDEDSGE